MNKIILIFFVLNVFFSNAQNLNDFENKVYKAGSKTDFDNYKKCDFYFECDCCFGEYVFLPKEKFIFIFYCSSDYVITGGKYKINKDSISLESTNQRIEINYNWEREENENAQMFFIKDSIAEKYNIKFLIEKCEDKTIIVNNGKQDSWLAMESNKSTGEIFEKFETIELRKYLEKILK